MKTELIFTGIIVPNDRYSYSEDERKKARENKSKFENELIAHLGLPDDWKEYFDLRSTSDFIALTEKGYYNTQTFRRFKRSKEATYPADLKEKLNEHIESEKQKKERADKKQSDYEYYSSLVKPIIEPLETPELNYSYSNYRSNDGYIEIILNKPSVYWEGKYNKISSITINHFGKLSEPEFKINQRYTANLPDMQEWINSNKSDREVLIIAATELIDLLPAEFFKPETIEQ